MENNYDALTGGIVLGGMRSKSDIRVLLCYILKSLNAPFSKSALNEVLQSTALANFFEVNDALASLSSGGLITSEKREDDEYYTLTASGSDMADRLETDLPLNVRKTAVASAVELLSRQRAAYGADSEIIKLEKGYHVRLTLRDGDQIMMQTLLYAADSLQANVISDSFMKAPEALYSGIIDSLEL
ncbi:MAG: DUF4364 family protein [Clostridia bacterium]|nr:DUF4364 family protein [Clostridia bacterium]